MKKKFVGFTILEVIVVILFIGILAAAAVYSLNITRASNRDAKRISDVAVIRAALSQYWLQQATYPASVGVDIGRPGTGTNKLVVGGFVGADSNVSPVYLDRVPVGPKSNEYYRYRGSSAGYSLRFVTERQTIYGTQGRWYVHSTGIDQEDAEK